MFNFMHYLDRWREEALAVCEKNLPRRIRGLEFAWVFGRIFLITLF